MKYKFPIIRHIEDIKPLLEDNNKFRLIEQDLYDCYIYEELGNDTFPQVQSNDDSIYRECRGIMFNKDGSISSRPYHKFFNVNEREETLVKNIDMGLPHTILEKLDGSMVRSVRFGDGTWRLATKRGITEISEQAEEWIQTNNQGYNYLIELMHDLDYTVIFEWCSRKNRIVVDYPEDRLVLTGLRHLYTGTYMNYYRMVDICETWKKYSPYARCPVEIDYVKTYNYDELYNLDSFVNTVKEIDNDQEGYVLRFDNGHMLKIKTELYCKIHSCINHLGSKRFVIQLILENKLDDIKPLLDASRLKMLQDFECKFISNFLYYKMLMEKTFKECKQWYPEKRDFAIKGSQNFGPTEKSLLFAAYDGKNIYEQMKAVILHHCSSNSRLERVQTMFGSLDWNVRFMGIQEE